MKPIESQISFIHLLTQNKMAERQPIFFCMQMTQENGDFGADFYILAAQVCAVDRFGPATGRHIGTRGRLFKFYRPNEIYWKVKRIFFKYPVN